ncbi:hypothetical protein ACFY36_49010 [Actinoplanes sp. NPDC000266]
MDQIGDGVAGVRLGDEVFGLTSTGSYVEFALSGVVAIKLQR